MCVCVCLYVRTVVVVVIVSDAAFMGNDPTHHLSLTRSLSFSFL